MSAPATVSLVIDLSRLDTTVLLDDWRWRVPATMRPVEMNKFGDWFLIDADGSVHFLDLLDGDLKKIAASLSEYSILKNEPDQQAEWFLDGLVFRCHREELILKEGECYGWRVHPMIGGRLEFGNLQVFNLRVYQSLMAQLLRQWLRLKPGDPIPHIQIDNTPP